tara:strand:- start:16 stop:180 length:165 start_codon:yes stop_codon:yes gene_type:complete
MKKQASGWIGSETLKTALGIRDANFYSAFDRSDISQIEGVHVIQHYVSKILPEF